MNWDNDATDALNRAPKLLRGMVKRRVEAYVGSRGGDRVTLADVEGARPGPVTSTEGCYRNRIVPNRVGLWKPP